MNFSPIQELTSEEKDLLWKFRFYLTRDKRALTKFLKCVIWTDPTEVKQAIELLSRWTEVDVDDALELLGPTFRNKAVRAYAVERLRKADDEVSIPRNKLTQELLLYLLQLVQALKFENIPNLKSREPNNDTTQSCALASFLISRAIQNPLLGNNFHWYLMVECEDRTSSSHRTFAKVAYQFMKSLSELPDGIERRDVFKRQAELVTKLQNISREIRNMRGDRGRKIERLKISIKESGLESMDALPLFLDASVQITGVTPGIFGLEGGTDLDDASVFKSSLSPLKLSFKTTDQDRPHYPIIFKTGDDLRQDQLVIQIVSLMDKLLLKENLDLKLTPYKIIATGVDHGAVQFIDSVSLNGAIAKGGSILGYLRANNPSHGAEYGVRKEVMETYIRSCGTLSPPPL